MLVEGPPDMISARSRGLPALAVPGDDAWEPQWARLLAGRHVGTPLRAVIRKHEAVAADPERIGGLARTQRTRGALTGRERRRLLGEIVRAQAIYVAGRWRLATGRVPEGAGSLSVADFWPPDSAFARTAEEACGAQSPAIRGHSHRSWLFGSALAALDLATVDRSAAAARLLPGGLVALSVSAVAGPSTSPTVRLIVPEWSSAPQLPPPLTATVGGR